MAKIVLSITKYVIYLYNTFWHSKNSPEGKNSGLPNEWIILGLSYTYNSV